MRCYFGVFDCYSPGGITKTLVMAGVFTSDDLYRVHIRLVEEDVL